MIHYREIPPPASLFEFVESFWTLEQTETGSVQRVVPDGHPELILNLGRPLEYLEEGKWHAQPRCFLAGQIEGPLLLRPTGSVNILGIRFRPHGASTVLDTPMPELTGRFTDVGDLSSAFSKDLDRALESADPIASVKAALMSRKIRGRDAIIAESVRRIIEQRGASDLSALADDLGLGRRQFERRFHANVGLTPKRFCRMQRFIHVFGAIQKRPLSWVDAAVECGYYDQAHLIRDFRAFSGETPAALLAEDADLARHFLQRFGVSRSSNTNRLGSL